MEPAGHDSHSPAPTALLYVFLGQTLHCDSDADAW